ncbi:MULTISPECIES: lipopolysaccharide assembly protein LapA domain-containing protein [Actinoalloteichus]|uniref:DUF1049 family protein n=1 Tax=Actinoalloteichus caeruleus DSM 43889 TaxID=1120930 RepID=A0ABT1JLL1_ACTCY|nr:LapA family protein [Actinoalloteichus caeruleus]MCP2333043.1 Protein of unknown function (DUF1049) [Actinoalloteichus caeruleus DSM 43889]
MRWSERTGPTRPAEDQDRARRRSLTRLVVGLLLGVLAVVFIVQNRDEVAIRLLVPVVDLPLWTALAGVLVLGMLIGALWVYRR